MVAQDRSAQPKTTSGDCLPPRLLTYQAQSRDPKYALLASYPRSFAWNAWHSHMQAQLISRTMSDRSGLATRDDHNLQGTDVYPTCSCRQAFYCAARTASSGWCILKRIWPCDSGAVTSLPVKSAPKHGCSLPTASTCESHPCLQEAARSFLHISEESVSLTVGHPINAIFTSSSIPILLPL